MTRIYANVLGRLWSNGILDFARNVSPNGKRQCGIAQKKAGSLLIPL
jgi:hypothetical protein